MSRFKALRAEPKSSAQILVTDSFGPSDKYANKSTTGLMPKTKQMELRGQPVLTPPKIQNKNPPSPIPEEKAWNHLIKPPDDVEILRWDLKGF